MYTQYMIKKCKQCEQEKDISEFSPNGKTKIGTQLYRSTCKFCTTNSETQKQFRLNRKSKNIQIRIETRDKCIICGGILWSTNESGYCKEHYTQSPKAKEENKAYRELHKDHLKQVREERTTPEMKEERRRKDRENKQERRSIDPNYARKLSKSSMVWQKNNPEKRKIISKKANKKYRSTPKGKLDSRMSTDIFLCLKGLKNNRSWETLVGYTVEDLKKHIQSQFIEGMTWDKYMNKEIDVDHIIPKQLFNYNTAEDLEFKLCWSLDNLRPMWSSINRSRQHQLPDFVPINLNQHYNIAIHNIKSGIKEPHRKDINLLHPKKVLSQ